MPGFVKFTRELGPGWEGGSKPPETMVLNLASFKIKPVLVDDASAKPKPASQPDDPRYSPTLRIAYQAREVDWVERLFEEWDVN
jgi:hypothetical protein